jgi:hypothetical protein
MLRKHSTTKLHPYPAFYLFVCLLIFAVLVKKPRASDLLGKCSITELHPRPTFIFSMYYCKLINFSFNVFIDAQNVPSLVKGSLYMYALEFF